MITTEQKILAIVAHIGYLVGGISLIIVPLVIYFWKKDDFFIADHAKQALVAQACLTLLTIASALLTFLIIGVLMWPVVFIIYLIFLVTSFIGAYRAFKGEYYQYPFIQDIVQKF